MVSLLVAVLLRCGIRGGFFSTNSLSPHSHNQKTGVIRSASRLRFRFGQVKLNDHSSFGVRRLVAAMVLGVSRKAATSRRTPYGLVICPSFARILTRTFNCTRIQMGCNYKCGSRSVPGIGARGGLPIQQFSLWHPSTVHDTTLYLRWIVKLDLLAFLESVAFLFGCQTFAQRCESCLWAAFVETYHQGPIQKSSEFRLMAP